MHERQQFRGLQARPGNLDGDWQIVQQMGEHRERELVGDAVGRVAQHAQRFARSGKWWTIRQCGRLRVEAPDRLRGVRQQLPRRIDDGRFFVRRQALLQAVALRIVERRQQQGVVHRARGLGLDVPLDEVGRLALIAGQQALVIAILRRERGRVGHQRPDELETWHVLAEHDKAHGQRRRHEQAERPPEPRPERHGREQRHLRDAGRPGIQHRFEHEIREQLEHDKQPDDIRAVRPSPRRPQG